mgnify:CR=1 FL=1
MPFNFSGKERRLYYNTIAGLDSGIMSQIPVSPGRPDFVLESERKVVCIIDAKCKIELDIEDAQRILSYILDYLYPNQKRLVALIFYISKEEKIKRIMVKDCEIYLIPMIPSSYSQVEEEIRRILESTL